MKNLVKKDDGGSRQERTMNSLLIARITGKQHKDVLKAIRNMEPAWEKTCGRKFALTSRKVKMPNGGYRTENFYELKFDECMYVAAKWEDETRAKLVKRWKELELQRIAEERNPEISVNKGVEAYRAQGKSDAWIATRVSGIVQRNVYTKTLQEHDVTRYGTCTDEIYKGLFGLRAAQLRERNGFPKGENLREHMSMVQLSSVMLSEALATEHIENKDIRGDMPCARVSRVSAGHVAKAVENGRKALGTE